MQHPPRILPGVLLGLLLPIALHAQGGGVVELDFPAAEKGRMLLRPPDNPAAGMRHPVLFFYHGQNGTPSVDIPLRYGAGRDWVLVGMGYRKKPEHETAFWSLVARDLQAANQQRLLLTTFRSLQADFARFPSQHPSSPFIARVKRKADALATALPATAGAPAAPAPAPAPVTTVPLRPPQRDIPLPPKVNRR